MTTLRMAHLKERSTSGGWIHFAVFEAKSTNGNNDLLLHELTSTAQAQGYRIDQSALAYMVGRSIQYYGDRNLVSYLSKSWRPQWTHRLTV
ncbi:hypothetical protein AAEH85_09250 [Shewanella algae]|uniref:hypothetical protein n=1 Tax=Shewanella algae TaxID=38313 RepID=UPI00313E3ECA